jgi:hypothetical protein
VLLQVFGIVAIQLLITVGFACVCLFVPEVKVSSSSQQQQQQSAVTAVVQHACASCACSEGEQQ